MRRSPWRRRRWRRTSWPASGAARVGIRITWPGPSTRRATRRHFLFRRLDDVLRSGRRSRRDACRQRCSVETLASRRRTTARWHGAVVAIVFQVLWAVQLAQVGRRNAAADHPGAGTDRRRRRRVFPTPASHWHAPAVVAATTEKRCPSFSEIATQCMIRMKSCW